MSEFPVAHISRCFAADNTGSILLNIVFAYFLYTGRTHKNPLAEYFLAFFSFFFNFRETTGANAGERERERGERGGGGMGRRERELVS